MDFAALPPEINSGRMYTGAGPGPLLAAASAWDALAGELSTAASAYESELSTLTGTWSGPSASTMAAAAAPYVSWMSTTSAQAEETANQARAAAAAYEAAFAGTVPPPVIAANRSLLATLVATNILGQNTPAIAATEVHYAEMWAQDAAAMYGYAGSAAVATQLSPFSEPPQTTNPSGSGNQAAAAAQAVGTSAGSNAAQQVSQAMTALPNALQSMAANPAALTIPPDFTTALTNWNTIWGTITGPYSPLLGWTSIPGGLFLASGQIWSWIMNSMAGQAFFAGPKAITGALAPLAGLAHSAVPAAGLGAHVTGAIGNGSMIGKLSVPSAWSVAAPATRLATMTSALATSIEAAPVAAIAGQDLMFGEMALASLAGRGLGATAGSAVGAASRSVGGGVVKDSFGAIPAGEADPAAATIIVIPAPED